MTLPRFEHFSAVGGGAYYATVTDTEMTRYLSKRGIKLSGVINAPLTAIKVKFSSKSGVTLSSEVNLSGYSYRHSPGGEWPAGRLPVRVDK